MLLYVFLPPLMGQTTWAQAWHDLLLLPFTFPSMAGHLWFMYPLISLYLIIPVISPWLATAAARDERTFLLFFVLMIDCQPIHSQKLLPSNQNQII